MVRRVRAATTLPVQTITRAEIDKAGVMTAAEIVGRISANVNGLTDGVSINVGGDQRGYHPTCTDTRGRRGFASPAYTLR